MKKQSMTGLKAALGALAIAALAAPAAHAAASRWAESDGGRMRLVALPNQHGGYDAALQIEPAPGWKTYWRHPGEAGLPPLVDIRGSDNVTLSSTRFPAPEIGQDEGGRFYGYYKAVGVMLELTSAKPAAPARLKAAVMIGLCKEICLPFQAEFDLALSPEARPESDEFMALATARSALPETPSDDFGIHASRMSDDGKSLQLTLRLPSGATPEVALSPSAGLAFGPAQFTPTGPREGVLDLPVTRRPESGPADVTILIKSGSRAMETTLAAE
ncbi:protein-disulfide reductase DsbD domain-containing protein [Rhizobium sp. G21]|uniref:protein-disulfide reductase DsbD domain-containing protein n=1 Tax=Rhizobium sp. G21 TaxID=2758439 RepID=UPI0015FF4D21|nr:protein-disulfide reductase DsbD domain-containing protein [Rhizobium sp. G21]MBB1248606.1 cytochrome C biogenesis protein [Rhizobium sp. G21]